jgi:hypothetical protein
MRGEPGSTLPLALWHSSDLVIESLKTRYCTVSSNSGLTIQLALANSVDLLENSLSPVGAPLEICFRSKYYERNSR